jgi:hypothetical protein
MVCFHRHVAYCSLLNGVSPSQVLRDTQARCDFLKGLYHEEPYTDLVACIDHFSVSLVFASAVFCFSDRLMMLQDEWPVPPGKGSGLAWLSWSYGAKHLPPEFHLDTAQYEQLSSWLLGHPYRTQGNDLYGQDVVILMCLGIGLVLRDLHAVQYVYGKEGVVADESAQHVQDSLLGWGQRQSLLRECVRLRKDIFDCFGLELEREETPLPEPHQPKVGESSKATRSGRQAQA